MKLEMRMCVDSPSEPYTGDAPLDTRLGRDCEVLEPEDNL